MPHLNISKFNTKPLRAIMCLTLVAAIAVTIPSFALDPAPHYSTPPVVALVPTIESTNYLVPSNAIHVDQTIGKTTNSGLAGAPVPTLALALSKVPSGGTIVVNAGVYREGDLSIYKNVTIQAAPNSQVWFDGTVLTSGWTADSAGGYKLSNSPSSGLCNDRTLCLDALDQINPAYPMSWSPQMVFVDDQLLNEVDTRAKAASGNNFFYDIAANTLYIGVSPIGKKVEVTAKRKFADLSAVTATLRGIGIRRYGSVLNPAKVQGTYHGAALQVAQGGNGRPSGIILENNTFFQNSSRGTSVSNTDNTIVRGNVFLSNGHNGFDSFQSNNLLVEKNHIRGNNISNFANSDSANLTVAGTKMVKTINGIIRNNVVEHNNGTGIWCDLACVGMKYYGNLIHNNSKHGIFYELSDAGTIASNVIFENGGEGIKLASPSTKIVHNTLFNNGNNIAVYEDGRRPPADPYSETRNNVIVNNLLASGGTSRTIKLLEINGFNNPDSVIPSQMITELDYNAYFRESAAAPRNAIGYRGASVNKSFLTHSAAKAEGIEPNGIGIDGTENALFVDRQRFNFNVSPNSRAATGGKVLTGDLAYIARDLNLASGISFGRGAISWQGKPNPTGTLPTQPTQATTPATGTQQTTPPTTPVSVTLPPPITAPPTAPPVASKQDIAIRKMISDHSLSKVRVDSWNDPILKGRAYYPKSGWLYIAVDFTATVDNQGNYTITNVNWIVSFSAIP